METLSELIGILLAIAIPLWLAYILTGVQARLKDKGKGKRNPRRRPL